MINLLVIIKMRHTLKLIGLSLMMLLLAACGSEDTPSQALSVGTQSTAGGAGNVLIQKGPVANATVIVKTYEGQDAGKATTNAEGSTKLIVVSPVYSSQKHVIRPERCTTALAKVRT